MQTHPLQNDAEHQRSTIDALNRLICLIRDATLPPSGEVSNSRSAHTSNLMIGCPPAGDGQLHASDWWARGGGQTADCGVSYQQDGPSAAGSFHTSAVLCQGRSPLMRFLKDWKHILRSLSFDPQTTQPRRGRTNLLFFLYWWLMIKTNSSRHGWHASFFWQEVTDLLLPRHPSQLTVLHSELAQPPPRPVRRSSLVPSLPPLGLELRNSLRSWSKHRPEQKAA